MVQKRVEDLQRMVSQVQRVPNGLDELKKRWQRHIYDQGFLMLNDEGLAKKQFRAI